MAITLKDNVARPRRGAFTLVELLVVIGIIALLASILAPSVSAVLKNAAITEVSVRIRAMGDALENFKSDKDYYPGQDDPDLMNSNATHWMHFMLTDYMEADYLEPKDEHVDDFGNPKRSCIHDGFAKNPMPILYYPARLGRNGVRPTDGTSAKNEFDFTDNSKITDILSPAADAEKFLTYITDERIEKVDDAGTDVFQAYHAGGYLLIGGSTDDLNNRTYFKPGDYRLTNIQK